MKTKLLKNLRNQAFENFDFTCSKWGEKWITKINNIEYQTSWGDSDMLHRLQDNDKILFLRECVVRTVKALREENVDSIVHLYDLIKNKKEEIRKNVMSDTQTEIFWQTGKPLKTGQYLVTIYYKSLNIYSVKTDYYHEQDGWTYYNDGSVVAWCDFNYIKPYTLKQK